MAYTSTAGPTEHLDDINARAPAFSQNWGWHLLLDASGCERSMNSEGTVAKFIADLVKALKMKSLGPLELIRVKGNQAWMYHFVGEQQIGQPGRLPDHPGLGRGISAVQVITTSTITFHGDDKGDQIFLDVFSCAPFEPATATELFRSRFKPKNVGTRFILRDARSARAANGNGGQKAPIEVADLKAPALLVCPPFTLSNDQPNNPLMGNHDAPVNRSKAFDQWMALYRELCKDALVYVLPHQGDYQDRPYVANIGCALGDTFLLSNFKSPPRRGEENVGQSFFADLGFEVRESQHYFEGEADLKWQRDKLYFGGYGIRTDRRAYDELSDLGIEVVPVRMADEKLYHFDCVYFPLDDQRAIVATEALSKADVRAIERHVHILPVPKAKQYDGWTNAVRLGSRIFTAAKSFVPQIEALGFEPVLVDLAEFDKSGADLSCLVCHLNHAQRGGRRYLAAYKRYKAMNGEPKNGSAAKATDLLRIMQGKR